MICFTSSKAAKYHLKAYTGPAKKTATDLANQLASFLPSSTMLTDEIFPHRKMAITIRMGDRLELANQSASFLPSSTMLTDEIFPHRKMAITIRMGDRLELAKLLLN